METMGLEPTTPCLQSRCSSQLSYVPGSGLHGSARCPIITRWTRGASCARHRRPSRTARVAAGRHRPVTARSATLAPWLIPAPTPIRSRTSRRRGTAASSAWKSVHSGCTSGVAPAAGTSAVVTAHRTNTRPRTSAKTAHPVIQSFEPGEDWYWCFIDEIAFERQGDHREPLAHLDTGFRPRVAAAPLTVDFRLR